MKKVSIFILFLCLLSSFFGFADPIYLSSSKEPTGFSIISDEVLAQMSPRILLRCHIGSMEMNEVETSEGTFSYLGIPNFQLSDKVGYPAIPVMNALVEIPLGCELSVRVLSQSETEYSLEQLGIRYPLMPKQPSHRKEFKQYPFVIHRDAYQINRYSDYYPLVDVSDVGILRHYRIAMVQVSPVLYNPVQGKIKVINDIEIEVSLTGADLSQTAQNKALYHSPYFEWVKDALLIPPSIASLESRDNPPVGYAIVSDRMFASSLAPFIAAKTEKGFVVQVGYTDVIGKTKEQIKAYLHNLYNNPTPENPAPSFVLFVGDFEQIPAFSGTQGSYITDLYYSTVTSGDNIPDMYYGRFSAQVTSDLDPQVEKTLEYEQYRLADTEFLKKTVLIAGWDYSHAVEWGYPQINYAVKYYFNPDNGFTSVHKFLSASSQHNTAQIREAIRSGACFVNYTAHGSATDWSDPSFTKTDIASMVNKGRYPLVVGNCCLTNKFEVSVCFGEAWLRAKDKGAIGYIGGSSYTYWDEDLWWGNGYYRIAHPNPQGLPPEKSTTDGGAYNIAFSAEFFPNAAMIMAGNLAVQKSTSSRKLYYWEVYHLMGDPALMVYWGVPSSLSVTHPSQISKKGTTILVQSEPNTYIGISMDGIVYGAGVTGSDGKINISLSDFAQTGQAKIQATKKNRISYVNTIQVVE